jgi:hypothetical protein
MRVNVNIESSRLFDRPFGGTNLHPVIAAQRSVMATYSRFTATEASGHPERMGVNN